MKNHAKIPWSTKSKISIVQINQTFQLNDSPSLTKPSEKGSQAKNRWQQQPNSELIAATSRLPTTFGARAFFTDLCCAVQRLVKALLGNYLRNENVFTSFTIVYNFNWIELNYLVVVHYIITAFYSDAQHF